MSVFHRMIWNFGCKLLWAFCTLCEMPSKKKYFLDLVYSTATHSNFHTFILDILSKDNISDLLMEIAKGYLIFLQNQATSSMASAQACKKI